MFPDATGLLAFMLRDLTWVVAGLQIFPDRMREHVLSFGGIAFSQRVLLALVAAGVPRDDAYRVVQRAAAAAWDDGGSFREAIQRDPEVERALDADALAACFDPSAFLANLGGVFDRLEKLPVEGS